jgi:hypothetical protein
MSVRNVHRAEEAWRHLLWEGWLKSKGCHGTVELHGNWNSGDSDSYMEGRVELSNGGQKKVCLGIDDWVVSTGARI